MCTLKLKSIDLLRKPKCRFEAVRIQGLKLTKKDISSQYNVYASCTFSGGNERGGNMDSEQSEGADAKALKYVYR